MHVAGIHHITAIASDPQKCVDFYTNILGLRLVKKSVNQDQVEAYHLFFGDRTGEPGMDLTFFTFPGIGKGIRGAGAVSRISLAVPESALPFWEKRFKEHKIKYQGIIERFGHKRLVFFDSDGQHLELVGVTGLESFTQNVWTTNEVSLEHAIRHFHSARIAVRSVVILDRLLMEMGYQETQSGDQMKQFSLPEISRAGQLEIELTPQLGFDSGMAGCVHHIAFAVADEAAAEQWREKLAGFGLQPTHIIDRYYFKSVYFRLPEGVLFELATIGPGFTTDEPEETLGEKLALPPFLEQHRENIEAQLIPIKTY